MTATSIRAAAAAGLVLACGGGATAMPFFTGVGDLPGGAFRSTATAISGDGTTVVGEAESATGGEAFRWTGLGTIAGLGDLPGAATRSYAYNVSADGSVVVGFSFAAASGPFPEAFRWTSALGMQGLGDLPGGNPWSTAYAVSADGSVASGLVSTGLGLEAMRWTLTNAATGAGTMQALGDLATGIVSAALLGMTPDASAFVGFGSLLADGSGGSKNAVIWTQAGGFQALGDFAGGITDSQANAVSADGSVVVGYGTISSGANARTAFRWTAATGLVSLGDLPTGASFSEALSVSADGRTIVGYGSTDLGTEAFIWREGAGLQNLRAVLINEAGLNLTGWKLTSATDLSADGLTICGAGINPSNQQEGWVARLRPPCPADFTGDGLVNSVDLGLLLANWDVANPSSGDTNGDGRVDARDLAQLLASWGACP